jgi:hypothetical protein
MACFSGSKFGARNANIEVWDSQRRAPQRSLFSRRAKAVVNEKSDISGLERGDTS